MPKDKISVRQLGALLFSALLSPMIQLLPRETAAAAGKAGWLTALPALPAALALAWALWTVMTCVPEEGGMACGLEYAFGRWAGRLITVLYLLWGLLLLGWNIRWCAFRFLSTSYRNGPLLLFIAILLGITLWVGRKKPVVLGRAGEIFALALGAALGFSLLFGAFQMKRANLGPIWTEEWAAVPGGVWPVLGLMGYAVFGAFLPNDTSSLKKEKRRLLRWSGWFCALLGLFQLICIGNFGPGLIRKMEIPFYMMVKGIGVQGAFQRVESLVMALWVLSDLALLGMLFFACRQMAEGWMGSRAKGWLPWGIALAAGGLAVGMLPDSYELSHVMERAAVAGNIVLGMALPVAAALVIRLRNAGKTEKEGSRTAGTEPPRKRKKEL